MVRIHHLLLEAGWCGKRYLEHATRVRWITKPRLYIRAHWIEHASKHVLIGNSVPAERLLLTSSPLEEQRASLLIMSVCSDLVCRIACVNEVQKDIVFLGLLVGHGLLV